MASCTKCGAACQGQMCRGCERTEHQEDYYGVPEDNFEDDEDESKIDELNDGLLEAFAAGFSQAVETFDIDADFDTSVSALKDNDALAEHHWYYWDGRSKPLEYWLRAEFGTSPLTRKQRETLQVAARKGYFDVPRRCSLDDLADHFDRSGQAISERLRRASEALVTDQLVAAGEGDA
ncbi:helix-turn-helix domain-containing protein [Haloarcula sp. S1CR25-12]|uniref:Helix-turn-helix domain-containing protein n=1 Tax=Haloarcula saliterrae TaxID=2950534 RepID=A0ABU2F8E4_9EURY|nr:helix-turn-helix domain-containing protein [Haloarcula sp. S1CR25-12]MDS0258540.1 helix-turn-helix domain-containing protein [Haloarcula sp. S1CR25-12]